MKRLKETIADFNPAPYVYAYPPTRMFKPTQEFNIDLPRFTKDLNVYIHIPFCNQKCSFCGYLTVIEKSGDLQDRYVDCVVKEIEMYADKIKAAKIASINFGGGTPSLLTVRQFAKIISALLKTNTGIFRTPEISIEATPESIESGKINAFKRLGINRVSIGIQSFNQTEIGLSRRHNLTDDSVNAIHALRKIGIANICCDLMYGLQGQTFRTWQQSVQQLAALQPDTIELYSTVSIPGTGFSKLDMLQSVMPDRDRLLSYSYARRIFLNSGYEQDCHLRFVLPDRGAYVQQENVFKGQSLIGFGVGAKSYAENLHYRNTYDSTQHKAALLTYMGTVERGELPVQDVVTISQEEKMRRWVIYNLEKLNKTWFVVQYAKRFEETFPEEYKTLLDLDLAQDDGRFITLTQQGLAYRDAIAREFFSEAAVNGESAYWAKPLAKANRDFTS